MTGSLIRILGGENDALHGDGELVRQDGNFSVTYVRTLLFTSASGALRCICVINRAGDASSVQQKQTIYAFLLTRTYVLASVAEFRAGYS